MSVSLDDLMTTREAAALLRVSERWLYDACANRRVPHTKVGHFLRFSRKELETYLAAQRVEVR